MRTLDVTFEQFEKQRDINRAEFWIDDFNENTKED